MSDAQTSEHTNGRQPNQQRRLTKAEVKARQVKAAATRAANKLAKANGSSQQLPATGAQPRAPAQRQPAGRQASTRMTAEPPALMMGLIRELPAPGSPFPPEKATAWLKAVEANMSVLYNLGANKIAA